MRRAAIRFLRRNDPPVPKQIRDEDISNRSPDQGTAMGRPEYVHFKFGSRVNGHPPLASVSCFGQMARLRHPAYGAYRCARCANGTLQAQRFALHGMSSS